MERRLAAILAADIVGYSRLMGANEVATLEALKALRRELLDPCIADHHGRTVKLTGDGTLVEFPSVVSALECAVEIQRDMRARNADVPPDRRIEFRIGLHLGDVIVDDDDLYGDGVNVASRLETVANTGGVAVSAAVYDNIGSRSPVEFEDGGMQSLKNIDSPVRVYHAVIGSGQSRQSASGPEAAEAEAKPSIAVLPFNNMSGDGEQEYFSDGITEDIITDLSKISGLFVVGRNTSFTYKGKSVQLTDAARELGVRYILEGSVRKAGDKVRVTGQLIDGATGGHVWADRYDRDLTDIFAIQDEITRAIVQQLKVRLLPDEKKAIADQPTDNVEAYSHYLRGRQYYRHINRRDMYLARKQFERAVALDPGFARAYAALANSLTRLVGTFGEKIPPDQLLAPAQKATEIAPQLAEAHTAYGYVLSVIGRMEEAEGHFERALEIDPDSFDANYLYGRVCFRLSKPQRAVQLMARAVELQPEDSESAMMMTNILRSLDRTDDAAEYARIGLKRAERELAANPENSRPAQLGACVLAEFGDKERAQRWMERALEIDPDDKIALYNAACMWASLGEPDRALDYLERWSANSAIETLEWIKRDPDIDPLREHPRYAKLIERIDKTLEQAVPAK